MRKTMLQRLMLLGLTTFLGLLTVGCVMVVPDEPRGTVVVKEREPVVTETIYVDDDHPGRIVHEYYYYPDIDVYFDPIGSWWFWFELGSWHRNKHLPHHIHIDKHHRHHFRTDARHPYDLHPRIKTYWKDHPSDHGGDHGDRDRHDDHDRDHRDDRGGHDGDRDDHRGDDRSGDRSDHQVGPGVAPKIEIQGEHRSDLRSGKMKFESKATPKVDLDVEPQIGPKITPKGIDKSAPGIESRGRLQESGRRR